MAANFSVKMACSICGTVITIVDTEELAKGSIGTKEPRYQCATCKVIIPISFTEIALEHSGSVGANSIITHTMATPGTIVSAVS